MIHSIQERRAWLAAVLLLLGFPVSLTAQSSSNSWLPVDRGERLTYSLYWPSGISLGEAFLVSSRSGNHVVLEATVAADLPQYRVSYYFRSETDEQLCSLRFTETLREGNRERKTVTEFDQRSHLARRTRNGSTAELSIPDCARDPLAQLYHFRRQLASGDLAIGTPKAVGSFHLGGDYSVRYEAITPETIKLGGKQWEGDRFLITTRGSNGERNFEIWIRPDDSRTPVAIRVPLSLATFSAALQ